MTEHPKRSRQILALVAIVCAGLNLRPAIVAVAPVTTEIRADLGVSSTTVGLLTAIPLICFAVLSPLVPRFSLRWRSERVVAGALGLLAAFSALRLLESLAAQLIAAIGIGAAIAIGNVTVPALIKRWFPRIPGLATGLFSVSLFLGAAAAGSFTYPLFSAFDGRWGAALAIWGLFAAIAVGVWAAAGHDPAPGPAAQPTAPAAALRIWRSPLAWFVTAYMGLQSLHYFTVTAWLPEILISAGHSAGFAGSVLGVSNVAAIVMALAVPIVANRTRGQGWVGAALVLLSAAGLLSLTSPAPFLAAVLLGAGQGGAIGLALLLIVLRTSSGIQAAALAGMSQSAGYLLAAVGPPVVGFLHDWSGSWAIPIAILVIALIAQLGAALVAGRPRTVGAP